jgi:drug/metabolite transporter (DMT)-like permease
MDATLHLRGLAITATGVLVLSLDAPLVRLVEAEALTVLVWRGLLMAVGFAAIALAVAPRGFLAGFGRLGRADWLAAICFGASNLCFVMAAKLIPVANLLLIIATTPLATAALARLILGERLRPATLVAILGALAGILVLISGELRLSDSLLGHGIAFGCTLGTGIFFTLLRRSEARDSAPIMVIGGALSGLAVLPVAWPAAVPSASVPYALLLGLAVLPVAFSLIAQGPRFLPAAEVSFLMLLETVLGPIWAWLLLSEMPSARAFAGGALVLASVAGHVAAGLRRGRAAAA